MLQTFILKNGMAGVRIIQLEHYVSRDNFIRISISSFNLLLQRSDDFNATTKYSVVSPLTSSRFFIEHPCQLVPKTFHVGAAVTDITKAKDPVYEDSSLLNMVNNFSITLFLNFSHDMSIRAIVRTYVSAVGRARPLFTVLFNDFKMRSRLLHDWL